MPIDTNFQKNRKKVGKEEGIAILGPLNPPQKLGVRGSNVAVDWDICTGCGICLNVCPMQLYDWRETAGHPTSEKKPFPDRESDCACCYECEAQCPVQAIRVVFRPPKTFSVAVPLMCAQIIGSVVYGIVFGPYLSLNIAFYVGWIVLAVGLPFFFSLAIYFPKAQEGKSVMDTTVIVDRGNLWNCSTSANSGVFPVNVWLYPHFPTLVECNYCRSNIRIVLSICTKGGKKPHHEVWQRLQTLYAKSAKYESFVGSYTSCKTQN